MLQFPFIQPVHEKPSASTPEQATESSGPEFLR